MPYRRVNLVEVGPRDGLQNEALPVSTETKLALIDGLLRAGLTTIEATAFVSPKWVPQMVDSTEVMAGLNAKLFEPLYQQASFPVLVPNLKGYERAVEAGVKRVAVVTAASETFNQKNINQSIAESLSGIQAIATRAVQDGLTVRGYISTAFVCPYEGKTCPETVGRLTSEMLAMSIDDVSIGDTIGAAGPRDIQTVLSWAFKHGVSPHQVSLHCHDTYGMALTNIWTAYNMGVRRFDSSVGGLGGCPYAPGASGNVATEDVLHLFQTLSVETGVEMSPLLEVAKFIQKTLGRPLPSKQLQRVLAAECQASCE
jgi:hydroxymethylglutaryl-CoA lyase